LTTPSSQAYFVTTEYSTDLKIPELGPAIGYQVNDYLSVGVNARLVAGHFRFKQAVGTDSTILKGTGIFNSGNPIRDTNTGAVLTYGEVLSGQGVTGDLGNVQFGYPEVQGIGRVENHYSGGFGWGAGIHYRPYGSNKLVLSASYKSKAVMDFKGGDLTMDFSDQFRKFYYDTAQFGEFDTATFGGSYLSNGAQTLRAPKFFNALLGTIDYPASQGDVLAQRAMEWFFNGVNKDGTPTLVRDANGYARFINLTSIYDPYTKFALPRELAFGAAWRPTERFLLSLEYRQIYMNDMVGDYFTITLDSGTSPFFDWLVGVPAAGEFDFSMHTDFNTIRSISVGAEYDMGNKWTIRGGVQHSNNTFTGDHVPLTFNMQPEDEFSTGFTYRLTDNWELGFAGSFAFTWDTTESKGTEKSGDSSFRDLDGDGFFDQFVKGSKIDQFHSNAEFDHKQWQLNFGLSYLW
jgi:long-subunit fatty acid transport protein